MQPEAIRALFLAELQELTASLSRGLLELEAQGGSAMLVDDLFRAAHSLKGAASVTGARAVADTAHGMESVLSAIRSGALTPDEAVITALLGAVDWLAQAARQLDAGGQPDQRQARSLRKSLSAIADAEDADASDAAPKPTSAPPSAPPAPPAPRVPPREPGAPRSSGRDVDVVRIPAAKLDALLRQTSEVTVARQRLEALERDVAQVSRSLEEHDRQWRRLRGALDAQRDLQAVRPEAVAALQRADATWRDVVASVQPLPVRAAVAERDLRLSAGPLAEQVLDLRTVPFGQVCEGLDRVVRDAARRAGDKDVTLVVEGTGVELDRPVALALRDPLVHLVHNAVDHGIELRADRAAAGKPEAGRITVAADVRGDRVEIVVRDDGAGLRRDAIRAAAARGGMGELEHPDDLVEAIFTPGLSTAEAVTETSGRGVGLDAVRDRMEGMAGSVDLVSVEGAGTTVTLLAPITLSILHTLTVAVGEQVVMLCSTGVVRLLHVEPADVRTIAGQRMVPVQGAHVPLVDLAQLLGWPSSDVPGEQCIPTILVRSVGGTNVGLTVSAFLGEGDVTVHSLSERVGQAPGVLGVTLLGDGGTALILSAVACARIALEQSPRARLRQADEPQATGPKPRILLAEDTMTTRVLEQGILEAAGYDVVAAVDGADAWERLQEAGADLVVSDIQMPRMDGLELCAAIRRSQRFADLPVVLVTSLADEADRRRGLEVGATAYLVKSGFEQGVLLDTVARLLG